ncbi:MAG: MBL fold metallo-hydrolase [bacterium]|nr:MBL fold metallo-hydrolase [bacterium]
MKIHAFQTGTTRIKPQFQRGNADRPLLPTFMAVLRDSPSIDLPILAWVIDHDEGLFVIDTGENPATTVTPVASMHVQPEEALGAQLAARSIDTKTVRMLVLTHLHTDHIGGIGAFRDTPVFVSAHDHAVLNHPLRRRISALANPIPGWLRPNPIPFTDGPFGAFPRHHKLTQRGDLVAVPTPGHTAGHLSVIAIDGDVQVMFAGDATYSQAALLARRIQGISFAKAEHPGTLATILKHAAAHPLIYLPSHDPDSPRRLSERHPVRVR